MLWSVLVLFVAAASAASISDSVPSCPKPNEHWDTCPSACFTDSCYDYQLQPAPCNTLVAHVCEPKCACKPGYARHPEKLSCVPVIECPPSELI